MVPFHCIMLSKLFALCFPNSDHKGQGGGGDQFYLYHVYSLSRTLADFSSHGKGEANNTGVSVTYYLKSLCSSKRKRKNWRRLWKAMGIQRKRLLRLTRTPQMLQRLLSPLTEEINCLLSKPVIAFNQLQTAKGGHEKTQSTHIAVGGCVLGKLAQRGVDAIY